MVAGCCQKGENVLKEWKEKLIAALNDLKIEDMEEVTELHALKGSFANLTYPLPNGESVKFWDDNKIYLGNLLPKKGGGSYGIVADENYLMVSECGEDVSHAKIVVLKRWN